MKRATLVLAAVTAAVFLAGQASPERPPAAGGGFPYALDPAGEPFVGQIAEVVAAGGYTYRRIDGDDGAVRWTVALSGPTEIGVRVRARPFGTARNFESRRTGRTFETLSFVTLKQE